MRATSEVIALRRDERGFVFDPADGAFGDYSSIQIVVNQPGAIPGNHYHRRNHELLVIMGPGLVRLRDCGEEQEVQVDEGVAMRFHIPPDVSHTVQTTGRAPYPRTTNGSALGGLLRTRCCTRGNRRSASRGGGERAG